MQAFCEHSNIETKKVIAVTDLCVTPAEMNKGNNVLPRPNQRNIQSHPATPACRKQFTIQHYVSNRSQLGPFSHSRRYRVTAGVDGPPR